jgi:hypothetical protein
MALTRLSNQSLTSVTALPAAISTGKVLQVVNGNFGTEQNINSTSYVDTAVTLNITPSSSSSKVIVISALNTDGYVNLSDHRQFYLRLMRDSSVLMYKQIQIGGEAVNSHIQ